MAKKRIISSILLCAFTILFAHSIIPHHHHDETAIANHGDHHDDDHDDIDNNFLGQAFSHFQHGTGSIIYEPASTVFQSSKSGIDKEAILYTQYVVALLFKPPIIYREHIPFIVIQSSFLPSCLFRGPPVA